MEKEFVKKNMKLSLDFDRYISRNPKILNSIPNGAWLVFTKKGDDNFNRMSWTIAGKIKADKQKIIEARKEGSRWNVRKFEFV
jgi:hypothetical protein